MTAAKCRCVGGTIGMVVLGTVLALAVTACDDSSSGHRRPAALGFPKPRGCRTLRAADVRRFAQINLLTRDLASQPDQRIHCSTMFYGGVGDVVLVITERTGGTRLLNRARRRDVVQLGTKSVRSLAALGPGAYLVQQRILSFRHGKWVVTLETGYSTSTHVPVLTVPQLEQLARIVIRRL